MTQPTMSAEPSQADFDAACKVYEEDCILTAYARLLAMSRVATQAISDVLVAATLAKALCEEEHSEPWQVVVDRLAAARDLIAQSYTGNHS